MEYNINIIVLMTSNYPSYPHHQAGKMRLLMTRQNAELKLDLSKVGLKFGQFLISLQTFVFCSFTIFGTF